MSHVSSHPTTCFHSLCVLSHFVLYAFSHPRTFRAVWATSFSRLFASRHQCSALCECVWHVGIWAGSILTGLPIFPLIHHRISSLCLLFSRGLHSHDVVIACVTFFLTLNNCSHISGFSGSFLSAFSVSLFSLSIFSLCFLSLFSVCVSCLFFSVGFVCFSQPYMGWVNGAPEQLYRTPKSNLRAQVCTAHDSRNAIAAMSTRHGAVWHNLHAELLQAASLLLLCLLVIQLYEHRVKMGCHNKDRGNYRV